MSTRAARFSSSPTTGDPRSEFQRDRDRVLYSYEFRRLSGVTQVASAAEGDVFHNRLTHSLKVAQVGRRIAERLIKEQTEQGKSSVGLDPDVVETAGLAHDLGHPPFGHDGEEAICRAMRDGGHEEGFEGNPQSFRIGTRLAVRYEDQNPPGLDLTRASLNAILKYPWLWERGVRKWGAYEEDADRFKWAREPFAGDERSIEARIMDWADDITYAVHDMEDFYRAGLIPLERLHRQDGTDLDPALVSLMDAHFSALDAPYDGGKHQRHVLRAATSALITKYINAVSLSESYPEDPHSMTVGEQAQTEVDLLKGLTENYVLRHSRVVSVRAGQKRMLEELFGIYMEVIDGRRGRDDALLPQATRDRLGSDDSPQRLAADLLASMTERQVVQTYQRLMGFLPGPMSYFDI